MSSDSEESGSMLHNLVKLTDDLSYNHSFAANYISDPNIENRNGIVRWMQHSVEVVLDGECPTTRDTSIQIFDKFIMFCYSECHSIIKNTEFLSYAAVASIILASKLNDTKSQLTMTKFSDYETDRLILFEQEILTMVGNKISPLCTPSTFLHYLISISPPAANKENILRNADFLIAEFLEDASSIMYAPSTIALSALLISFSHYKVPCGAWVNSIPMYFFINEENPFFQCMQGLDESGAPLCPTALFLDHESCIAAFERMHNLRRSPVPSSNSSGKSGNSSCQSSLCSSPTPTTSSCGTSENSPVSVSDRALCRSQQT